MGSAAGGRDRERPGELQRGAPFLASSVPAHGLDAKDHSVCVAKIEPSERDTRIGFSDEILARG